MRCRTLLTCRLFGFLGLGLAAESPVPASRYLGAGAGFTTGMGLAFRWWEGTLGWQVNLLSNYYPLYPFYSAGVSGLVLVDDARWSRFFGSFGGSGNISQRPGYSEGSIQAGLAASFGLPHEIQRCSLPLRGCVAPPVRPGPGGYSPGLGSSLLPVLRPRGQGLHHRSRDPHGRGSTAGKKGPSWFKAPHSPSGWASGTTWNLSLGTTLPWIWKRAWGST